MFLGNKSQTVSYADDFTTVENKFLISKFWASDAFKIIRIHLFSLVSDMKTFSYIRRWTLHINHYNIINYLGIFNWYSIHPKNVLEAPYWDSFYLIKHETSAVVIRKKNGKMQCADTDWLTGKCAWVYIWRKHHIEAILKSD